MLAGRDDSAPDAGRAVGVIVAGVILALVAMASGWIVEPFGMVPGLITAGGVGIVGGFVLRTSRPEAPVLGLMAATVLLGSPLIPEAGRYLPALACMIALTITTASSLRDGLSLRWPTRWVSVLVLMYIVIAALTTVSSIDQRLSAIYLLGSAATLVLAFVAVPTMISTATTRLAFVAMAGIIGVALAMMSLVLWIAGPFIPFHEPIGLYLITELRVADVPTGMIIPRASGPYLTPGYQALNLSIGLFALLAIRTSAGRARSLVAAGIVLVVVAILLTMVRGGWLVAACGALAVVILIVMRSGRQAGAASSGRSVDAFAVGSFLVIGLTLVLLLGDVLGADARYDLAQVRYGDAAAGTSAEDVVTGPPPAPAASPGGTGSPSASPPPVSVRGGAESSSRGVIWSASLNAIAARPITGYGPGTNALALAPWLDGPNATYKGLTSHSTWLRTAIEMGLGGLVALLGIIVTTVLIVIRDRRADARLIEPTSVALLAAVAALVVGQSTETLLLGGLTYASLFWAMAIGIVVSRPVSVSRPRFRPASATNRTLGAAVESLE